MFWSRNTDEAKRICNDGANSAKQRKAIYLPFEASGEPLISELVSKMLLLANDTQISDATILAQIAPLRQAA